MFGRRRHAPQPGVRTPVDLVAVVEDDELFRRWYDTTAPRVYAYVYSRTGSVTVAEELTQETFVEVIRNPRSFDGRPDELPWLIGIARHRLARYLGKLSGDDGAREVVREIEMASPVDVIRQADERASVGDAMAALPPLQRAALMLRFVDDLPVREVATLLGRSEDATESLIRRARAAFEDHFRGHGR